jgi:hypothetical protein
VAAFANLASGEWGSSMSIVMAPQGAYAIFIEWSKSNDGFTDKVPVVAFDGCKPLVIHNHKLCSAKEYIKRIKKLREADGKDEIVWWTLDVTGESDMPIGLHDIHRSLNNIQDRIYE